MKLDEFQQLGKNVKYIVTKFAENPGKFASVVLQMYWDVEKERDSYKQQRNELINDIADIKRKAQAFDEILNVDYIVTPDDYAHEITKIVDKYWEEQ